MKVRNGLLGAALVMGFALGGDRAATAGDIDLLGPLFGPRYGATSYAYSGGWDRGAFVGHYHHARGCRPVHHHHHHVWRPCHVRRHHHVRHYHVARAYGYHGVCGWPYAFPGEGSVYFALGNGWPFGCRAGGAGDWPYYHGVGVGVSPGGKHFGFAYNFKPYAICRQGHGPRFCRRHFQDYVF